MNYKFPLINLITRGHVRVENPKSTVNFLESLTNNGASIICEDIFYMDDSNKVANYLDAVQEEFELFTGTRNLPSSDSFSSQRDVFFLKEAVSPTSSVDPKEDAAKIVRMLKRGLPIAAVMFILTKYDKSNRQMLINNVKLLNKDVANLLSKSWATNWIIKGGGFAKRAASSILTAKNHMTDGDITALKRIGWGSLIAASAIGAVVMVGMIYKRRFSKEAKECSQYQGRDRTICMSKARLLAAKEAQKQSEKALQNCDSAKNPEDCRFKMRVEIRSWMKKIRKEEETLKKLTRVKDTAFEPKKKPNPFE